MNAATATLLALTYYAYLQFYYINFVDLRDLRLCADNDTLETSLTEPASAMGVSAWRQRIDMMWLNLF